MKALLVASAALVSGSAAVAGPYINVEGNSGFYGSDYVGSTINAAIGYKTNIGDRAGVYAQVGPTFVNPDDGEDGTTQLGGKIGGDVDLSEKINVYAEGEILTAEVGDNSYNLKTGLTWNF
tara:strand:+ start:443 stop:805 length:363 start_codon:yes stop_codon:yes gene_type:complete